MKVELFEIHFDNAQGVFHVGGPVSGKVVLRLGESTKLRSIALSFEGKGKSYWDVRSGKHTTKYRAHETYINTAIVLFGGPNAEATSHPAGFHEYPFAVNLPLTAPSSFEGRRGYVRYISRAVLDRPWKFDHSTKRAFTVIHHLDLNIIRNADAPIDLAHQEHIETCCCDGGSVSMNFHLDKTGFVPGEAVVYKIEINNQSDSNCTGLQLSLQQIVVYTAFSDSLFSSGNPKYHTKTESYSLFNGPFTVEKQQTGSLHRAALIPSLPPSYLEGCGIVNIQYKVHVQLECGWTTISLEKEILVGTIPLRPPQITPPVMQQPLEASAPFTPPAYFPIDAPPSYEECVSGKVQINDETDDAHTTGQMSWAPAYPYYTLPAYSTLPPSDQPGPSMSQEPIITQPQSYTQL